jgi:predicted alpha/beta-hydrolase family hydrolase
MAGHALMLAQPLRRRKLAQPHQKAMDRPTPASSVSLVDVPVPTSLGPSRIVVDEAADARAVLLLGHGAGGGVNAPDLAALAARLPARGITVVRYEQPWRTAGRRVAARPAALDIAWLEAVRVISGLAAGPLVVGGRSAGARVACRTPAAVGAVGVVCLSFPLHPPGRPEKSRLDELLLPEVPVVVLQGDRDTFGSAATVITEVGTAMITTDSDPAHRTPGTAGPRDIRVVEVPGADHGLKVLASSPLSARDVADLVVDTVGLFVREMTIDAAPFGGDPSQRDA